MNRRKLIHGLVGVALAVSIGSLTITHASAATKEIVYLTPGLDLPFWRYLSEGIQKVAKDKGYDYQALDSHNSAQTQLRNAQDAIARGVAGIIISPTDRWSGNVDPSRRRPATSRPIPMIRAAPVCWYLVRYSSCRSWSGDGIRMFTFRPITSAAG